MDSTVKKIAVFGLCSLMSFTVFAGGPMNWVKIDSMVQRECVPNKGLELTFTTPHANPDACFNSQTVEVSCELATYKAVLAMALTAQSADLEVNGFVNGCDADNQAILKSIRIRTATQ